MSKRVKPTRLDSLQKAYFNDILAKRIASYKMVSKKILKDMPTNENNIKSVANDGVVDSMKKSISDSVNYFYTILSDKKLYKSVSNLIGKKFKKRNQDEYKKYINSNKNIKKHFQKLQYDEGISLNDLIDNENLKDYIDTSIKANVELIKTMDKEVFSSIEKAVYQNIAGANDKDVLSDSLLDIGARSDKRAKMIAKDQTNKILENINKQRSISLGATKFEWQTTGKKTISQGGTSRDEHASFDGKIYTYKDGAGSRHILPGQDVNCQCTALPIFGDDDE